MDVDMSVVAFDAASLLRNGVVSVRRLCVQNPPASFSAFLADARRCSSLSELQLNARPDTVPEIEALVDFALNKPLTALSLEGTELTPASMPALARLVSGGSLTALDVHMGHVLASPAFCAVSAAPLVFLYLESAQVFDDLKAGLSLLVAVTGHKTLRHLSLAESPFAPAGRAAVGAALGLLVAANSPLATLEIWGCDLGNDGLLSFVDALPRNTHLRRLNCADNEFTQLTATRLLAAVRANASLIFLEAEEEDPEGNDDPELVGVLAEAMMVVAARAT